MLVAVGCHEALRDLKATLPAASASSAQATAEDTRTEPTSDVDGSVAASPGVSSAHSESEIAQRMAKIVSNLSAQARRHPKLSELMGVNAMDLCSSSDAVDSAYA